MGVQARLLETSDDEVILCLECAPSVDEEGFTRVGRPVIPRPVGGTIGDAIELAKANRFKELESKEKKMKKKSKDKLEDNNGSDMSPSDCIVLPLIQSFTFSEVTQTAEVVVRPSGNFGRHGSGALLGPGDHGGNGSQASVKVVNDVEIQIRLASGDGSPDEVGATLHGQSLLSSSLSSVQPRSEKRVRATLHAVLASE